ncbi:hypothetical protein D3C84_860060 [compost metagenome]
MVKEAERTPLGQCHQPNGELGQLHRQWVQIHSVEATLGNQATSDHQPIFGISWQAFEVAEITATHTFAGDTPSGCFLCSPSFDDSLGEPAANLY